MADDSTKKTAALPVLEVSFENSGHSVIIPKEYVLGKMKLTDTNNSVVEMNAKFKTRGATAQKYTMKPSFNMKLRDENNVEKDSALLGMRSISSWILDAMAIDRIGMRNRVCFDLWNDFSKLPYETKYDSRNGTEGRFVEVYINNKYTGIYCMTDRINRKLLNLKKSEVNEDGIVTIHGVIYKHGTNDIANQNSVCFSEDSVAHVINYHDAWELAEPEEYAGLKAWKALEDAYVYRKDTKWISEHFYLNQLAEYQIFITALSIGDNWGNKNSIISARNVAADGDKKRFVYTPWDMDSSLGGAYDGKYYDGNYFNWTPADIQKASTKPIPFDICNNMPEYKTALRKAWIKGRKGALSVDSLKSKLYNYRDLFINSGAWERYCSYWDTQKNKPCYVTDLAKEIEYIIDWYANRHIAMDTFFNVTDADVYEEDDAVINIYANEPDDETIFNLLGVKVINPQRGIYIKGGKKFIVR